MFKRVRQSTGAAADKHPGSVATKQHSWHNLHRQHTDQPGQAWVVLQHAPEASQLGAGIHTLVAGVDVVRTGHVHAGVVEA